MSSKQIKLESNLTTQNLIQLQTQKVSADSERRHSPNNQLFCLFVLTFLHDGS